MCSLSIQVYRRCRWRSLLRTPSRAPGSSIVRRRASARPAPCVRISQQGRRHQYSPRTLSRREFGDDGDRRQRHADVLRRLDQCQVADRFKHAARARSEHGTTLAASPRPADNDRVGLSNLRHAGLGGLFAPARTPTDIVEKLNREVRRAVERPDLQKRLLTVGMEPPPPQTPADFRTFVENDVARWTQFVDAVGVNKLKGETSQQ